MYVCVCNAVTDREIRAAHAQGVRSVTELRESTGVASCCGACEDTAEEILVQGCTNDGCACMSGAVA